MSDQEQQFLVCFATSALYPRPHGRVLTVRKINDYRPAWLLPLSMFWLLPMLPLLRTLTATLSLSPLHLLSMPLTSGLCCIAVAFHFLVVVSAVVVEVDSPGHPSFLAFPNID